MTQNQALKIMLSGANVFLTGPPGSGKTYLLNEYINISRKNNLKVAVTATTGIASTHLNGTTIHSWSGIGLSSSLEDWALSSIKKDVNLKNRYLDTDVLVIDEVSMLDGPRLDLLNSLAKYFRRNSRPFGGLQLLLVGDLFQLPPVKAEQKSLIFLSSTWSELELKICYLDEQHRQNQGDELNHILSAVRSGRISGSEMAILTSRLTSGLERADILRLYSHNFDADAVNARFLNKLQTREKIYKMRTKGSSEAVGQLTKSILSPKTLRLKVDEEVIFTANDYKKGYVNGDRGRVVDFKSGWPVVRMLRQAYITVISHCWQRDLNGQKVARAWQLPLRPAWAITIHKSQGMSLDEAQIDLSRAFSPGMGYVALSRLRSIDGLYLLGINKMAFYVDSRILKVDGLLRAESDKLM